MQVILFILICKYIMNIPTQFVLLFIFSFVAGSLAYSFSDEWSKKLQATYIAQAKQSHLDPKHWKGSFTRRMFKYGFVFMGVILGGIVFSILFGPIEL